MNDRLRDLLDQVATHYADRQLRDTYGVIDHASLVRLSSSAAGVENFIKLITELPNSATRTGHGVR